MILIFTHKSTYRLQYICQFIFKEQLGVPYSITLHEQGFQDHKGPRINYSHQKFESPSIFNIRNHTLLIESGITTQDVRCIESGGYAALFPVNDSEIDFDIFAAAFYLISRYEEYLPHEKDIYGRYAHENSIAYKQNFLKLPLINIWINKFADQLKTKFPELNFKRPTFKFIPTYDIDIAWSYQAKGIIRNVGGFLKSPSIERLKVLSGFKKDPYDAYSFLDALHNTSGMEPLYFFLVAAKKSRLDKNVDRGSKPMIELLKNHAAKYRIGIHPSWSSFSSPEMILEEKNYLANTTGVQITKSRQHYIKVSMPETLQHLIHTGITDDYSMGYGSINGFRASVASSFLWYNLKEEKSTSLRIHPFCYMDANSHFEQKLNAHDAYTELMFYYALCRELNTTLITIFHNNFLGDGKMKEWKNFYEKFVNTVTEDIKLRSLVL